MAPEIILECQKTREGSNFGTRRPGEIYFSPKYSENYEE
jgi:hypothetical protein